MSTPLSSSLDWRLANKLWSQSLNPIIANPIVNGKLISNIALVSGNNVINHGLGRNMQGWFLVDVYNVSAGPVDVYRTAPLNNLTLTLNSDAALTVSIWVF